MEPAESKFVIDDEGQAVFQDIIKDSLEEEIHAFMAEIAQDNIRKLHGSYKCPFCPFRAFKRLCQLSDHLRKHHVIAKQFVCSGTKQMKVILALHDADAAQRKAGADYLFRSALSLQTQIAPPLDQHKNCIDKDIRLLLQKDGPRYVNKNALGEQIHARRVLNIYYDKSFAEMIYREIVLHHSSVPWPHKWFWRSGPFAKRGRGEGYIYIYIYVAELFQDHCLLRSRASGLACIFAPWSLAIFWVIYTRLIPAIGGLSWRTSSCRIKLGPSRDQ